MSKGELSLNQIIEDLKSVFFGVQTHQKYALVLQETHALSLHLLPYLHFLEKLEFIKFDRKTNQIQTTTEGETKIQSSGLWSDDASIEFRDYIFPIVFDVFPNDQTQNVEADIIQIDDGIEIIDAKALVKIETETEKNKDENKETLTKKQTSNLTPPEPQVTQDTFSRKLTSNTDALPEPSNEGYDREELIGSGAYGSVFKSKQLKLNRYVALKEVKAIFDVFASMQREDIIERFSEIVQIQASLLHPNIMQIIDFEIGAQFPFVVMQYAPNGNLRRVIEHAERPNLQISLKYFFQILHALNTAHDQGVTHGGIKPENVVLDHAGNALITDFGISSVAAADPNSNASQVYVGVGTIAYMSPEQFRDPNTSSMKSDIYSLGIMFYEMLTGKVPGRRSPMPSSFYPDIPRKLDDIFDRMSMDDPNERYNSIDEILRDLYNTPAVMKIIDKRGGFLFLRDPILHGAVGMEGLAEIKDDEDEILLENDGNMLNKLDKYGKLFEGEE